MKVYDLQNEKGNVSALILVERGEIEGQENCTPDEALTNAITNAIMSLAHSTGQNFVFTRILSYDEQDDGAVMVRFETAVAPEVKLGQYKGVQVNGAADREDFADRALALAAENIDAEVPALIVERELDGIWMEKKSAVLGDVYLNLLTDIYKVLEQGVRELTPEYSRDELWEQAVDTTHLYFGQGQEVGMDEMVSAAANVLSLYGKITDRLCARLVQIIEERMGEREKLTGESLADQVFETYLRLKGFSPEQWMENQRPEALERTRMNLTLDAVADAEGLSVGEGEVREELEKLAEEYGLEAEQVGQMVSEDALRFHLRREKAKKLIADHAVRV